MESFSKVAAGSISPSRFVKTAGQADGKCAQCGAGDQIYGISQTGTRNTPYGSLDDGFAAIAGENVRIYGPPQKDVMLQVAGTVFDGDRLKSDANGMGVTTTTANDEVGAIASANGVAYQLIPVQCIGPQKL